MNENIIIDKKSLKFLRGAHTDWYELAKDCICFANAQGGFIYIGIEDNETVPPKNILNQDDEAGLRNWIGRLIELGLVVKTGKGKGTQYSLNPEFIRQINFRGLLKSQYNRHCLHFVKAKHKVILKVLCDGDNPKQSRDTGVLDCFAPLAMTGKKY